MRHSLPSLLVGLLFGAGLTLSGMVNPARVLGFLDIFGRWDPTLAFVLFSALIPSALAYLLTRRMRRPLTANEFCIPQNQELEPRLIAGAAIFGIGWGLVGLCPDPALTGLALTGLALTGLALGRWEYWLVAGALLLGMELQRIYADVRDGRRFTLLGASR